ncbi:MAG TPA: DegT/DnrJ/EryC1/StrS family aminotransferase [Propionibacteriaceae bacterium]
MAASVRYARKRLDITVAELAYGLGACLRAPSRTAVTARLGAAWRPTWACVACLSVRSGFDLLLASTGWPSGSEVLMSAVTIPHLATLVRAHGYVPVAVDVAPATMEVDLGALDSARTSRTRALVYAHLFGARADVSALAGWARSHGLLFVEDCAQCYDGSTRTLGDADVAMYSFGTIKTATCLGGAVLMVTDPALRRRMQDRQRTYPIQRSTAYAAKLIKAAVLLGLGVPMAYARVTRALQVITGDYDAVVRTLTRGFSDERLLAAIRCQPSTALLALMRHRFETYDSTRLAARQRAGDLLAAALGPQVQHLGGSGRQHSHWLFPVTSHDPDALVAAGRAAGFDLTRGSSTLVALDPCCVMAAAAIRDVVYLPAYPHMPASVLLVLAEVANAAERTAAPDRLAT